MLGDQAQKGEGDEECKGGSRQNGEKKENKRDA
jgi:hypothetical protein